MDDSVIKKIQALTSFRGLLALPFFLLACLFTGLFELILGEEMDIKN